MPEKVTILELCEKREKEEEKRVPGSAYLRFIIFIQVPLA